MLKDVSIFLFGVMGVWIGIIYPKSLKNIFKINRDVPSNLKDLKAIFFPIRNATLILLITIAVKWVYPLVIGANIVQSNRELLLRLSFSVITFSVFVLCWSLCLTLVPLDSSEAQVVNAENIRDTIGKITRDR